MASKSEGEYVLWVVECISLIMFTLSFVTPCATFHHHNVTGGWVTTEQIHIEIDQHSVAQSTWSNSTPEEMFQYEVRWRDLDRDLFQTSLEICSSRNTNSSCNFLRGMLDLSNLFQHELCPLFYTSFIISFGVTICDSLAIISASSFGKERGGEKEARIHLGLMVIQLITIGLMAGAAGKSLSDNGVNDCLDRILSNNAVPGLNKWLDGDGKGGPSGSFLSAQLGTAAITACIAALFVLVSVIIHAYFAAAFYCAAHITSSYDQHGNELEELPNNMSRESDGAQQSDWLGEHPRVSRQELLSARLRSHDLSRREDLGRAARRQQVALAQSRPDPVILGELVVVSGTTGAGTFGASDDIDIGFAEVLSM